MTDADLNREIAEAMGYTFGRTRDWVDIYAPDGKLIFGVSGPTDYVNERFMEACRNFLADETANAGLIERAKLAVIPMLHVWTAGQPWYNGAVLCLANSATDDSRMRAVCLAFLRASQQGTLAAINDGR